MTRRRSYGSPVLAAVMACLLLAGFGRPVPGALALMGDSETIDGSFATEVLDPPTSLTATAALLLRVNLSWAASVDSRATGYQVFRGTTSGGPYTQIATVPSPTTTTYQDTVPLPGQYHYVLRTYVAAWTSVNSNQASVLAA